MSNNYGFSSLILPPGKVRLRASYVGFKAMEIEIDLQRDTMIDFPLRVIGLVRRGRYSGDRPRYEILSSRAGDRRTCRAGEVDAPLCWGRRIW